VLQPLKVRDDAFLDSIRGFAPDLGVVVAYGRILPDNLLAIPRLGMINVHGSLLPRYRGAAPIQRSVMAGDTETGITIMRVGSELDAGATFSMQAVPIPEQATSGEMADVLAAIGAELLLPVVDALAGGTAHETPQDHARATLAPKISKAEGTIDWRAPARTIHNLARGLQPWPLASTSLKGTRLVIRRTQIDSHHGPEAPGAVVRADGDVLVVACGEQTSLRVLELQPEGKRTLTAREFLAGRGIRAGDVLGS
jgi:methionyl-tRNA formyltransferase